MPISALSAEEVWDGTFPAADENAAYSGGSGLQEDPYLISTAEDLAQLSVNTNEIPDYTVDKYFKQTADIILNSPDVFARDEKGYITGIAEGKTANAWTPIGNHFYFTNSFCGNYDGAGHAVRGIYIETEVDYQGLFGYINNGSVSRLGIEDSFIFGWSWVGGVAGILWYGSTVKRSNNRGTVFGTYDIGGLVGFNCATVKYSYNTGTVSGTDFVGGIVGYNGDSSVVTQCYNIGSISGSEFVGGVAGNNSFSKELSESFNAGPVSGNAVIGGVAGSNSWYSSLVNCYNIGRVWGTESVGGVVGEVSYYATVENCYYLNTCTEISSEFGTALTEAQMQETTDFIGFDFESVWMLDPTTEYYYPILRSIGYIVSTPVIAVTGVSLNKTALQLKAGENETLIATIRPTDATNKNVTWTSSDTDVASVHDGLVTAKKAGTAVITVITEDGNFTAVCAVTVTQPVTGVELNKSSLTLQVGESEGLLAAVLPDDATNKQVVWTSSNSSVASVSQNGAVTALKVGTAVITVTTADGGFTATCNITVEPKKVTGVTLNKTTLTLKVGLTETLSAAVMPSDASDKAVTWSSDNTAVAAVSSGGVVTAVKEGTATITVTTADGGFTATCAVTVVPNKIELKPGLGYKLNESGTIVYNIKPETKVSDLVKNFAGSGTIEVRNKDGVLLSGDKFVGTGAIINLIAGGRVVDTLIVAVLGDVNGDGKVLANDARLVLRHVAKLGTLAELQMLAGDTDGNKKIEATDARIILRVAAKLHKF